jgi:hypothetical protein
LSRSFFLYYLSPSCLFVYCSKLHISITSFCKRKKNNDSSFAASLC